MSAGFVGSPKIVPEWMELELRIAEARAAGRAEVLAQVAGLSAAILNGRDDPSPQEMVRHDKAVDALRALVAGQPAEKTDKMTASEAVALFSRGAPVSPELRAECQRLYGQPGEPMVRVADVKKILGDLHAVMQTYDTTETGLMQASLSVAEALQDIARLCGLEVR